MANKEQSEHIDLESVVSAPKSNPETSQPPRQAPSETQKTQSEEQLTEEGVEAEVADLEFNIDELQQELEEAQAKAEDNWNKLLRAQAELENLRKRSKRDLENAHKYAIERFVNELLPVKDSLELGVSHSGENTNAEKLHEGMELTLKMLSQVMEKFNIEEVDPLGKPFNPDLHQAMTLQENTKLAPNTVTAVMQKGYVLNGRLIRPAMVIVSKAPD